jgi:two-component system OmpR family sensor kinase
MLRNLLDNAARHAEREVDIELTAVLEGNHPQSMPTIIVQVRDDGPGFPPEHVDRVFEPFVRLDEARRRDDGGSGLGLSIVSATVRQMGGAVLAHPGPGGHVEVRLPANSRAARTERAACSDSAQLRPVSVEQRMSSWRGPA